MSDLGNVIIEEIYRAMTPFNPGIVEIWIEDEVAFDKRKIFVRSRNLPNDVFTDDLDYKMLVTWPENIAEKVAHDASIFFASRREPVESNVQLGEN